MLFRASLLLSLLPLCWLRPLIAHKPRPFAADSLSDSSRFIQHFFHSPLGIPLRLISNFGDFRANHFHSGLDLSTGGQEGLAVYASAKGYVSRVKIAWGGYGNALYITHRNGYVSVYGHLKTYSSRILESIHRIQLQTKRSTLDRYFKPEELPVNTGEIIGLSGNTGISGGPHLHFEIRDQNTEHVINPLLFGLPIIDRTAPIIHTLLVYAVQDEFSTRKMKLIAQYPCVSTNDNHCTIREKILLSSDQRYILGLVADDQIGTQVAKKSVYKVVLTINHAPWFSSVMDEFGFDQTRCINSFLDFNAFSTRGQKIQRLYIDPGNPLLIYGSSPRQKTITQAGDQAQRVNIAVSDAAGNHAFLSANVYYSAPQIRRLVPVKTEQEIRIAYTSAAHIPMGKASLFIPSRALFDGVALKPGRVSEESADLKNEEIAIKDSIRLTWRIPPRYTNRKNNVYIEHKNNAFLSSIQGDSISTWIHEFGVYHLTLDTIPPHIQLLTHLKGLLSGNPEIFSIRILDDQSGLDRLDAYLDNHWVPAEYDPKTRRAQLWVSTPLSTGAHQLKIIASDLVHNSSEFTDLFEIHH